MAEGLVKELSGPHARFDGNVTEHHHFTCLGCGRITDVDGPTTESHSRAHTCDLFEYLAVLHVRGRLDTGFPNAPGTIAY